MSQFLKNEGGQVVNGDKLNCSLFHIFSCDFEGRSVTPWIYLYVHVVPYLFRNDFFTLLSLLGCEDCTPQSTWFSTRLLYLGELTEFEYYCIVWSDLGGRGVLNSFD